MNETMNTTEWITLVEAGKMHGMTRQAVLKWVTRGWVSSIRIGCQYLVHRPEIAAYTPHRGGYKNIEQTGDDITRVSQQAKAATSPEPTTDGLPVVHGGEDATRTSPAHQF